MSGSVASSAAGYRELSPAMFEVAEPLGVVELLGPGVLDVEPWRAARVEDEPDPEDEPPDPLLDDDEELDDDDLLDEDEDDEDEEFKELDEELIDLDDEYDDADETERPRPGHRFDE